MKRADRLHLIKARHRIQRRRDGLPCGLSAVEIRQVRVQLGRGVDPKMIARFHGVTEQKIRRAGRSAPYHAGKAFDLVNERKDSIERRSVVRWTRKK